jgi:hypothetical protein
MRFLKRFVLLSVWDLLRIVELVAWIVGVVVLVYAANVEGVRDVWTGAYMITFVILAFCGLVGISKKLVKSWKDTEFMGILVPASTCDHAFQVCKSCSHE